MIQIERPQPGEQTGPQNRAGTVDLWQDWAEELNLPGDRAGFRQAPPASPRTYKRMRSHPTLFIARTAITSPILAGDDPTIDAEVSDAVRADIERMIHDLYWPFVNHALTAIDFGFAGYEKVWSGSGRALHISKLKALSPTKTEPVADDDTGELFGVKQGRVILPLASCAWHTNDSLAGDLWGTSRLNGIRAVWQWWNDAMQQAGTYLNKVAGVVPIIEYPSGESRMGTGAAVSNYDVAAKLARGLASGKAVVMPNTMADYMKDFARAGVKPSDVKAWSIQFLEAKGDHTSGMINIARLLDTYMLRGYAVPERAVTEGTHGTKAEAESHGNIVYMSAQRTIDDITSDFTDQVVKHEVLFRHGQEAAASIALRAPAIIDETREFIGMIIDRMVSGAAMDLIAPMLDLRTLLERRGLPTLEEVEAPMQAPGASPIADMVRQLWERAATGKAP